MLAMGGPIGSGFGVMIEVNVTEQSSESQARAVADQYYQQIEGGYPLYPRNRKSRDGSIRNRIGSDDD